MEIGDLEVGQIHNVHVTEVRDSSLIVDCDGVRADVPGSELSWTDGVNPPQSYQIGDEIDALIVSVNPQNGHVQMSVRRADQQWRIAIEALRPGQIHEVRVIEVRDSSLIVDCDGVRADVPGSELPWTDDVNPPQRYQIGDEIDALIIAVNRQKGHVQMSVRRADQQWRNAIEALRPGQIHEVRVIEVRDSSLIVDCDGVRAVVPGPELSWDKETKLSDFSVGQTMRAFVIATPQNRSDPLLSVRRVDTNRWYTAVANLDVGQIVHAYIDIEQIVNALSEQRSLAINADANGIPARIFSEEVSWDGIITGDFTNGETVPAVITEIEHDRRQLNLFLLDSDTKDWATAVSQLHLGQLVDAQVLHRTSDFVHVETGGIRGTVHATELSWDTNLKPSSFSIAQPVKASVLRIDYERRRLRLSLRRADTEGWRQAVADLKTGMLVDATVTQHTMDSLYVDALGIRGVIQAWEISWDGEAKLSDFSVGQTVRALITDIDRDQQQLQLSIRRMDKSSWQSKVSQLEHGKKYSGKITRITKEFLGITLNGLAGSIHQREISWNGDYTTADYSVDDIVDVMLMNVDDDEMEVFFSIRRADAAAWDKIVSQFTVGQVFTGRITGKTRNVLHVDISGISGVVFKNELSWTGSGTTDDYEIGIKVRVAVADIQWHTQELFLSIRRADPSPWIRQMRNVSIGNTIQARVRYPNAVGVILQFGEIEFFVPRSELPNPVSDPRGTFQRGQLVNPVVTDIDRERCYVALSFAKTIDDFEFDEIVARGESGIVEFKPGLKTQPNTAGRDMEHEVLKTIVAFLNSVEGGWLLIGVTNTGYPVGIVREGWKSADTAQMRLTKLVKQRIGSDFGPVVRTKAFIPRGKEVVGVRCDPAPKGALLDGKEYFYRDGSESRQFKELEEIFEHQRNLQYARKIREDVGSGD